MTLDRTVEDDERAALSVDDYRRRFSNIRVELDWKAFEAENWPTYALTLTDRDELLDLRSFFGDRFGRINPRFLKTLGTRSLRIGEAASRIGEFPAAQRDLILSWADDFRLGRQEPRLELPSFHLPDGTHLVLDGNHHATALALADVPFEIELVAVKGRRSAGFAGMRFA